MIISKVMVSTPLNSINRAKATPAFGLAKLNETGEKTADVFGYQRNAFLNDDLFEKQGLFRKAAISGLLTDGAKFSDICADYGCTQHAGANAKFIESQILSGKGKKVLKSLDAKEVQRGLTRLFEANYDNPELSTDSTKKLLELIKESLPPDVYVQNVGMFEVGVDD